MMQRDASRPDTAATKPLRRRSPLAGKRTIAVALGLLVLPVLPAAAARLGACRPTLAAYETLKPGMRREAVTRRLGCPGTKVSGLRIGENGRTTYSWRGKGSYGANLNVTFRNGVLASKSQLGLE